MIGSILEWPTAPDGAPLTLVMSIPVTFLNEHAGCNLPQEMFVSVFSHYSDREYFLDTITYHGSADELEVIREGFTRVILHKKGTEEFGIVQVPAIAIDIENSEPDNNKQSTISKLGGEPDLLQAEPLDLGREKFILQIYGSNFPKPYQGIFGLSDAIGYLFIDPYQKISENFSDIGTFFVQVT